MFQQKIRGVWNRDGIGIEVGIIVWIRVIGKKFLVTHIVGAWK